MVLVMASVQSKRDLAPVMVIQPMTLVVQRQRHHPLLWARAFARCDLAPFRECQNNTHFGSTRTDAKEDRPDQTRQRQIAATVQVSRSAAEFSYG